LAEVLRCLSAEIASRLTHGIAVSASLGRPAARRSRAVGEAAGVNTSPMVPVACVHAGRFSHGPAASRPAPDVQGIRVIRVIRG